VEVLMDIKAFNLKDLQNLKALASALAEGPLTDLAALTRYLDRRISEVIMVRRKSEIKGRVQVRKAGKGNGAAVCPACGATAWVPAYNRDDVKVFGCTVCRYSRLEA
jgi:hypothetical protein